jgi:hypothetical protein
VVLDEMGEAAFDLDVLAVAVGADALVALPLILLAQGVRVEIQDQVVQGASVVHGFPSGSLQSAF